MLPGVCVVGEIEDRLEQQEEEGEERVFLTPMPSCYLVIMVCGLLGAQKEEAQKTKTRPHA